MKTFSKKTAMGFVNFDAASGANNEVEIRIPYEKLRQLTRGKYVIISSGTEHEYYLARLTRGPFYTPDAVSRDSAFARASIIQAENIEFIPDYHGICYAELIGIVNIDSSLPSLLSGPQTRPHPKSPVFSLPDEEIENLLNLQGNMYLGQLSGYPNIRVHFNANSKSVLPRNVGIFGTVGSGKTNSSQVLIEEASANGWAVIVIDVEGEYISMDEPSSEILKNKRLSALADRFKIKPEGLKIFQVYYPAGTEGKRKDALEFSIPFGSLSPYELSAIMGMNETQEDRFVSLWDLQKEKIIGSSPTRKKRSRNQWEALEEGSIDDESEYPDLTVSDMIVTLQERLGVACPRSLYQLE